MREFTLSSANGSRVHELNLLSVIETVPDLTNDELEHIVHLSKNESVQIDNLLVTRTK